jgi:hypothetical protein
MYKSEYLFLTELEYKMQCNYMFKNRIYFASEYRTLLCTSLTQALWKNVEGAASVCILSAGLLIFRLIFLSEWVLLLISVEVLLIVPKTAGMGRSTGSKIRTLVSKIHNCNQIASASLISRHLGAKKKSPLSFTKYSVVIYS